MVYALKPGSLHPLRERYCQTLNILLRKELRICTSGVRKTIMATPQAAADSDTIKAEGKHVRQEVHLSCVGGSLTGNLDVCQRQCACCCVSGMVGGILPTPHLLQLLAACSLD